MNTIELCWTSGLAATEKHPLLQTVSAWLEAEPHSKTKTTAELADLSFGMFATQTQSGVERLLGFGALSRLDGCSWELSSVVVDPEQRGTGIGSFIVSQLREFFFEYGEPTFGDLCLVCQPSLEQYYAMLGFGTVSAACPSLNAPLKQKAEYAAADSKVFMLAIAI